jgi:hypothetical protein
VALVGFSRLTRRTISRAVTCSAWRRLVNAVKATSATSASEIQRASSSSQIAFGYRIGVHAASPIEAMAALTVGVVRAVTENRAPARRAAAATSYP